MIGQAAQPNQHQYRPMTTLCFAMAVVLALVMLYLPFQFYSLPLRYIYPYLRWIGLAYAASGLMIALSRFDVFPPRWVELGGKGLLIATLAVHSYLVAYKTGVVTGEFVYAVLLAVIALSALRPDWENALFLALYTVMPIGIGVLMTFRPGLFPAAVFGDLPATLGPILIVGGLQLGAAVLASLRWPIAIWLSLLFAALPLGWFSLCWGLVGNWLGVALYGTWSVMALLQVVRLVWPWHVHLPSLRRRVLALVLSTAVLPLLAMGTFAVNAAQTLESDSTLRALSIRVLQAERAVDQLLRETPAAARLIPVELSRELKRLLPDPESTVDVVALAQIPSDWTVGEHVGTREGFLTGQERRLVAYIVRPDLDVALAASVPAALAYDLANRVAIAALSLTTGFSLLTLVAGLMLTKRITARVNEVRNLAVAIGSRHFGRQIPIRHDEDDDDEVSDLVVSVNSMSSALETYSSEVRSLNSTLEQRVAERTAELLAANQELEAFSYSVSHDLRGPLRNIDGFSQVLGEEYGNQLGAEGLGYLERIRVGTRRMSQLIDALLQLARVARMPVHRDPVDLTALLHSVADSLRRLQPERSITVRIQPGMSVTADAQLLRIAVENLLHNAFKFTGKVPEALVECGAQQDGGRTLFYVRDNGAGFDMAYVDKLFAPFSRLHPESQFEGTGVGLATVLRIMRRHGGRVWAEGAVGSGATFYFSLESG